MKKSILTFPYKARIQEEAASWLARMQGDPLRDEERERLEAWLRSSKQHREIFAQLAHLWNDMACMTVLGELFPLPGKCEAQVRGPDRHRHWFGATVASVALVATLLVGAVSYTFLRNSELTSHTEPVELVYQTRTGQLSDVTLKDGSTVTLNTRSHMRVRFDEHRRSIYLVAGEAHFEVAKDRERPFVVYAGKGQVRAVGTAFNVRLHGDRVGVLVSEGTVEVVTNNTASTTMQEENPGPQTLTLKEGGSASFAGAIDDTSYLPREKLEQRLAWRKGKWMFEGETLAEVIREVNRYTDTKIEIVDPGIAELRIGGYFDIGEIDGLMNVLQAGFGVQVDRTGDNRIQLSGLVTTVH